jgi:hypothetical protein
MKEPVFIRRPGLGVEVERSHQQRLNDSIRLFGDFYAIRRRNRRIRQSLWLSFFSILILVVWSVWFIWETQ